MNRKILPHCLLINLTETSNSTYILILVDIIEKILVLNMKFPASKLLFMNKSPCTVSFRYKKYQNFCFNKVKNAFCLYHFLASHLNSLNGKIFHKFNIDNSECPVFKQFIIGSRRLLLSFRLQWSCFSYSLIFILIVLHLVGETTLAFFSGQTGSCEEEWETM